jgi:tetratricopeptide (TPR) repeat protein
MKKLLVLLLVYSTVTFAVSDNLNQLFMQGNSFYREKQYKKAIEKYREILKTNSNSFKVNYNLGCSYFRLNDFANARLYFERADKLKPNDKKVLNNLRILKLKLKDKIEIPKKGVVEKSVEYFTQPFSYNAAAIMFLVCLLIAFLFISLIISARFDNKPLYYGLFGAIFFTVLFFGVYNSKINSIQKKEAVVFAEEVEVFSEPGTDSALLFKLHSGTKVSIEESDKGFYHISLPNGMNGWANTHGFNKI